MPPVGFEPTISAGELPQTYALDRAAAGTDSFLIKCGNISFSIRTLLTGVMFMYGLFMFMYGLFMFMYGLFMFMYGDPD